MENKIIQEETIGNIRIQLIQVSENKGDELFTTYDLIVSYNIITQRRAYITFVEGRDAYSLVLNTVKNTIDSLKQKDI